MSLLEDVKAQAVAVAAHGSDKLHEFLKFEAEFHGQGLINWIQVNWMLPIVSCAVYLFIVFLGPVVMKGRFMIWPSRWPNNGVPRSEAVFSTVVALSSRLYSLLA
jgi:hypothetical protein